MMTPEQSKIAEERSICQKFWEMDSFLEDGGWRQLGRQSLEQVVEIGERLLHSDNFEIKKNVSAVVEGYKEILAGISLRSSCEE